MFYIYIIKSKKDNSIYIGYTGNLIKRIKEHNNGKNTSTCHKTPFELIYYEAYKSKSDAKFRENNLKRFAQAYTQLKRRIRNGLE